MSGTRRQRGCARVAGTSRTGTMWSRGCDRGQPEHPARARPIERRTIDTRAAFPSARHHRRFGAVAPERRDENVPMWLTLTLNQGGLMTELESRTQGTTHGAAGSMVSVIAAMQDY